uniref:RNA-dependent RNA polymerase n=1 Tax=Downy mildew lesion associated ormycovirus 7 TaxID=3162775 RepID=A0AAT9QEV4_9VIRU|nr:putative RNA-dependent RNA polymerase [Plasmopara viticola lesion-associated ormycovirus 7]
MIEWSPDAIILGNELLKTRDLDCLSRDKHFGPHALLMYERLNHHRTYYKGNFDDPLFMVASSLIKGPAFTEEYLSDWKQARFEWMNMEFSQKPDKPARLKMDSYASAYLGFHFIFWKEEVDDYKSMFDGVPEHTNPETLDELESIMDQLSRRLISDDEIMSDPPDEYIFQPVATGGFTGERTMPEWEIEFDSPEGDIEEEILICARSIAPKRPGETRDIGIQKPSCLRFHRRIMWLLKKACNRIPGCPYGRGSEYLKRMITRLGTRNSNFYMRDYTKSGMTIPHEVQERVFKGFYSRRPDLGAKAARFFKDQQLFIKDPASGEYVLTRPDTGSPLGLFVEGYTLLQYAIHELNTRALDVPSHSFQFSATNDDMVVGCNSEVDIRAYVQVDQLHNTELGMQYKDTKSGITKNRFVYCEEYWIDDHIDSKDCLYTGSIMGAKFALNTFHAKEYVYAILLSAGYISNQMQLAIQEVQSHLGYEFHEDEFQWPFLFGGWLPCIKDGLDHSIEWYNGDLKAQAGYFASRTRLRTKGRLGTKPNLALGRKFGIKLVSEPDDLPNWVDLVPFLGTRRTLERHYRRGQSHPTTILKEYNTLAQKRHESYTNYMSGKYEIPSVMDQWVIRHPNSVWLPSMPGMRFADPLTRVDRPRYGFKDNSLQMKLINLRSLGHIDVRGTGHVSNTMIKLAKAGITDVCEFPYLPMAEEGISTKLLAIQPRGFIPWYEKHGKVPLSLCEDDEPHPVTKLWGYLPASSLLTVSRSMDFLKSKFGNPSYQHFIWFSSQLSMIGKIHHVGSFEPDDIENETLPTEGTLLIEAQLRDVIRDWFPDADEIIAGLKDRIIPLDSEKYKMEYLHALQMTTSDNPFTLAPGRAGEKGTGDSQSEVHSDSEIDDPWGELGVT